MESSRSSQLRASPRAMVYDKLQSSAGLQIRTGETSLAHPNTAWGKPA